MPKKIRYESAVHQFFVAASRYKVRLEAQSPARANRFSEWIRHVHVGYPNSQFTVSWRYPRPGSVCIDLKESTFYARGDRLNGAGAGGNPARWTGAEFSHGDPVAASNADFFDRQIKRAVEAAGLFESVGCPDTRTGDSEQLLFSEKHRRKDAEARFHDEWASGVDVDAIDVRAMNEACTAPEMRYIRSQLGNLQGLKLLDVGCGLGEASVYFALEGATVTATDISQGMLDTAQRLAEANGVSITTVLSASEDFSPNANVSQFDIIYTGNTLHHVDIEQTLDVLLPFLKKDGLFVSWDPLAYNPIINVYRRMATEVRTVDEHPLRLADLRTLRNRFQQTQTRFFWLTTLLIFLIMAVVQRRSPNKERYWKKVVEEAERWAPLHRPLEYLDHMLLGMFPFLRPLCWNVVFIGRGPTASRNEPGH